MNQINTADEIERELRRLVAYAQSDHPSRTRIARELTQLSERLAGVDLYQKIELRRGQMNSRAQEAIRELNLAMNAFEHVQLLIEELADAGAAGVDHVARTLATKKTIFRRGLANLTDLIEGDLRAVDSEIREFLHSGE